MEELLIGLVVIIVAGLVIFALLQWFGITIDPVLMKIASYIIVGIFIVVLIRLLWPVLVSGTLPGLK